MMSENKETKEENKEEEEEKATETPKPEQLPVTEGNVREKGGKGDEPAAPKSDENKIDVLLKATGNAPIMKRKKWAVGQERKVAGVIEFIKNYLRLEPNESLFLYVNQAFAPSPDQTIKNLYECFGADGKLVLHYCKSQAWG